MSFKEWSPVKKGLVLVAGVFVAIGILNQSGKEAPPTASELHEAAVATSPPSVKATPVSVAKPNLPPLAQRAIVTVIAEHTEAGLPTVSGTSNLPDDTDIGVTVESQSKQLGYRASADAKIINGRFTAGPFDNGGVPLQVGKYKVSAVVPVPAVQSDAVRAVIGENGERLKGKQVQKDDVLGPSVWASVEFFVGASKNAAKKADKASDGRISAEASAIYADAQRLIAVGNGEMAQLRRQTDLAATQKCGERMRHYQAEAQALSDRANKLPMPFISLKAAVTRLNLCVSCNENLATDSLRLAAQELKEASSKVH